MEITNECNVCGKVISEFENAMYDGQCKDCANDGKELVEVG